MTRQEFQAVLEESFTIMRSTLEIKRDEYATTEDVLRNFKESSRLAKKPAEQCLMGFVLKQFVSLNDLIDANRNEKTLMEEKIKDILNYMILLRAILKDKEAS